MFRRPSDWLMVFYFIFPIFHVTSFFPFLNIVKFPAGLNFCFEAKDLSSNLLNMDNDY